MLFFTEALYSLGKKKGRSNLAQTTPAQGSRGMVVMGGYLELDIMQDQGNIRLAACATGGCPCQGAGWAAGYAETIESLVRYLWLFS